MIRFKTAFRKYPVLIFTLVCILTCIFNYSEVTVQTRLAAERCLFSVIPSLYAPMFTACLITRSNYHIKIGKLLSPVSRYIFRLPPEIFAVFLISNVSGYPSGIKLLEGLRKNGQIDEDQLREYSSFCFSAGPAFVAGTVSSGITASVNIGLIIFLSTFAANLTIAFILGRFRKIPEKTVIKTGVSEGVLVGAASDTSAGMLGMCTMITVFSLVRTAAERYGLISTASELVRKFTGISTASCTAAVLSFLEITNISGIRIYTSEVIPVMAALFAFGGVCVISQVSYISGGRIRAHVFLAYRSLAALLSYIICLILCRIFTDDICITASSFELHSSDHSMFPSVILIIMSIMLTAFQSSDERKSLHKTQSSQNT